MIRKKVIGAAAIALFTVLAATGGASAEPAHTDPGAPAKRAFGPGFPNLIDHEWGFLLGGFGGVSKGAPRKYVPVIFVHGNNVDAADWYPVRDDFRAAGWTDQEMWALSYGGRGGQNGTALLRANPERDAEHSAEGSGPSWITNDEVNVPDLYDFILAVRAYTGSRRFSIVGHSLGVTLARRVLKVHPELRADLAAFVGIAGANHGTSLCPPGSEGNVVSCNEIAAGTQWLADLNGPGGVDETYPPAKWLTIYDGTGAGDPAYAGPTYAKSPALRGAENREKPYTYHNDLRIDAPIVADYRPFVEIADFGHPTFADPPAVGATSRRAARSHGHRHSTGGTIPATGGAVPLWPSALAIGGWLVWSRYRRRRVT